MKNPFDITKAFDFTDQEINDYWVDYGNGGFLSLISPSSPMSQIILGGKGSGKTHLMRYHSYFLKKLRAKDNLIEELCKDSYIGIYYTCSGMDSSRFFTKNIEDKVKMQGLFDYYMELWIALGLVKVLCDMAKSCNGLFNENDICASICKLFSTNDVVANCFEDLFNVLSDMKKNIDVAINNYPYTNELDVFINTSRGSLIFGIPKVISSSVKELNSCQFVYLIDEFENFYESQQKYVHTLIREKKLPVTFRIGVRKYGVKTYETYCDGEINKIENEFKPVYLDDILRDNPSKYKKFAKELIVKRLRKFGIPCNCDCDLVESFFEDYPDPDDEWMLSVIAKSKEKKRKYFEKLSKQLLSLRETFPNNHLTKSEVNEIISLLKNDKSPLNEKANIHKFYQIWSKTKKVEELLEKAKEIVSKSDNKKILEYYRKDFLAQFCRDYKQPDRSHIGLENFIDMSQGLPRNLLIILKEIYGWAIHNGESPFLDGLISIKSQIKGVEDAADWFMRDVRISDGRDDERSKCLYRLAELFGDIRFSDKPPECSLCAFSFSESDCSNEIINIIESLEHVSLLIRVLKGRQDRNSTKTDMKYQLSSMLATKWKLPISRRGDIRLSKDELIAIFASEDDSLYKMIKKKRLVRMNAPFCESAISEGSTLFEV